MIEAITAPELLTCATNDGLPRPDMSTEPPSGNAVYPREPVYTGRHVRRVQYLRTAFRDRSGHSGAMKVAACQAPLLSAGSPEAIDFIREQVRRCEWEGVSILCCPEAILGGLADYIENPSRFAIRTNNGQLDEVLMPLASDTVTLIVGFTELADDNQLFNAAAVFGRGRVSGLYRKLHPAIRRSVYSPGSATPVFRVGKLTFGIVICYDSTFSEPARAMAAQGAKALFVPANNALPKTRGYAELVHEARASDIARAVENRVWVIRADVAGINSDLASHGSSAIVDPNGNVMRDADLRSTDLLVADIAA